MNQKNVAYIELTFAMVIVGSLSVVGKKVIEVFPVMLSSLIALMLASIGMYFVHRVMVGHVPKLNFLQLKLIGLQTLFGVVLFRVFFLYGLYWSSASMAGILIALTPVVIALLSMCILREKVSPSVMAGILFCMIGVAICQSSELMLSRNWWVLAGVGLILLAMICEAMFTVFRKKLTYESLNPITSNFYLCVIGSVLFLPFGIYDLQNFDLLSTTSTDWIPILYTAVFVNIISFILWFSGVDKVDATVAGVFTVIMPITSLILSAMILGEMITWTMIIGMVIIIMGLLLVIYSPDELPQSAS